MHEAKLVRDLMSEIDSLAKANTADHVDTIRLQIGALSHVTPDSLQGHFELLAHGSVAEDAKLDITKSNDNTAPDAFDVRLLSVVVSGG